MKAKKKQPVSRVHVKSEDVMNTQQKTNKRGKTKLKSNYTSKSTHTDLNTGEVVKSDTRQTDKVKRGGKKKTKFKSDFSVRDKEGKLLVKQKDRNKRTKLRVTRRGKKAGY